MLCESVGGGERAVSPVMGVVFLVVVVVATAATVGVFAFGMLDSTSQPPPQVVFEVEYETSGGQILVTVEHKGGDDLERERLTIKGTKSGELTLAPGEPYELGSRIVDGKPVQPGERLAIVYDMEGKASAVLTREKVPRLLEPGTTTSTSTPSTSTSTPGGSSPGIAAGAVILALLLAELLVGHDRDGEDGEE